MRVLIVGAGIAGLATAIALRGEGMDVTLVERAPMLTEVGAGVVLGPHAMRVVEWLGAGAHIRNTNTRQEAYSSFDLLTGEERLKVLLGDQGKELYGAVPFQTHRRDLVDALVGQLNGADVRLNCDVVRVEQDDEGVNLHLGTGESIRGDFLVGADGFRSTVRKALFGESEAIFTGFLAWRTVIDASALPEPPRTGAWLGASRHVVFYPIRKGKQFYAAFYVPAHEIHREDWSISGDVADLRSSFSDACKDVRRIAEAVDQAFITGIYYREPLPVWHKGAALLIGDAAHPVLPTSGSGAGVALEDAVALAACLRRHATDLSAAFGEFEARRKPRTTRLLLSSRADLEAFHDTNHVTVAARARMNRGIRRLDPSGRERIAWLYGYDEIAESAKPFKAFNRSAFDIPKRSVARRAFDHWAKAVRLEDSVGGWVSERLAYERFMGGLGSRSDEQVEAVDCDGIPAIRVVPHGMENGPCVLHVHGGGFIYGSPTTSINFAAAIARSVRGWTLIPNYRLAPEHSAQDMQADMAKAFAWLAHRDSRIFVSGECAGGNLAVSLAINLRNNRAVQPLALYILSPLADLTLTASSIDTNQKSDPWMTRARLLSFAGAYLQDRDPTDPAMSVVRANLSGLPPMRIFSASNEALADDARMLTDRAVSSGVNAKLRMVGDSVHSYALFDFLPETEEFFCQIAKHSQSVL